jgi:hypothetical protein
VAKIDYDNLLLLIKEEEAKINQARLEVSNYKNLMLKAESELVAAKIAKERLEEQLEDAYYMKTEKTASFPEFD